MQENLTVPLQKTRIILNSGTGKWHDWDNTVGGGNGFGILEIPGCSTSCDMMGQWTLNGNANDGSGFGANGTLNGNATYGAGKVNQAVYLDGTGDFVNIGNPEQLRITGNQTICYVALSHKFFTKSKSLG
ncbi:MAG: hypothetical protein IPI53_11350 [Saprospiraceae bacterium]|nr:hypothetical protein [Saprospiraceae bacterium]